MLYGGLKKNIGLKSIVLSIFLVTSFIGTSQVNLNEYKYVVVPKRFDGFKNENQYQTSTLIKYLFNQKGFSTVYDDNLPEDLTSDRCLGVYVDLVNNSSMFTTKTALALKDCSNQEVFTTQVGRSKKKDYRESYSEAINKAFNSLASMNYSYEPKEGAKQEEPVTISFKNDIKTLEEETVVKKNEDPLVEQIATEEVQYYKDRTPIETDYKKANSSNDSKIVEQEATEEEQSFKSMEPVQVGYTKEEPSSVSKVSSGTLYAQELSNGYQLVDSTPRIQLKIFKSSMPNVYIAKAEGRDGVVYSSDGKWFFEYHEGGQIVKEELTIKF